MTDQPRILIVRTDRMGDVILSTPVIRALRRAFPQAYLGMMIRPEHRELVEGNRDLNAVILYDKRGKERGVLGNLRFARQLRSHRFDTALLLHSTNRVILASWLAGIRRRVGYARRLRWLLTHPAPYIKREGNRHEVEYNLDLLQKIGVQPQREEPVVPTTPIQEEKIRAFLNRSGLNLNRPLIALHPGASCPSKRWPAERFSATADRLVEDRAAQIVVVTGPGESEYGERVLRLMRHKAASAFGTLGLGELACLLRLSRCLISNDSGPVHLACAVGTPVVAIFGRWGGGLSPVRWGPVGRPSVVLHRDIGCRPCLAHRCSVGFACLEAVSVDEVVAAAGYLAFEEKDAPFSMR